MNIPENLDADLKKMGINPSPQKYSAELPPKPLGPKWNDQSPSFLKDNGHNPLKYAKSAPIKKEADIKNPDSDLENLGLNPTPAKYAQHYPNKSPLICIILNIFAILEMLGGVFMCIYLSIEKLKAWGISALVSSLLGAALLMAISQLCKSASRIEVSNAEILKSLKQK